VKPLMRWTYISTLHKHVYSLIFRVRVMLP